MNRPKSSWARRTLEQLRHSMFVCYSWTKTNWAHVERSDRLSAAALIATFVVSVAAVIVSLVGLYIGIQESRRTREHERLSVVPKLASQFVNGSDSDITGIVLKNDGLGPAHVLTVRLSTVNKVIGDIYGDDQWRTLFTEVGAPPPKIHTFSAMTDFYIPAGGTTPLLWLRNNERTDAGMKFLTDVEAHVMISSCFCSLYDECWRLAAPAQKDEPCDLLASYYLSNKGALAEQLKGKPRVIEPRSVQ